MKVIYEKKTDDLYYRDGSSCPLKCSAHLHYYVEIVYMRKGHAKAFIDSDVYDMESGDLLLVFPNRIHRFEDMESNNQYDLFIVNPDIVPDLTERISEENPEDPVIRNVKRNPRLLSLIGVLSDVKNFPQAYRDYLVRGYFLAFFAETLEMLPMRAVKSDENQAMRTVIRYCALNFTKDLSLTILEEELHLSKYYISHLFGDKLGIRFNDYINSLRISESCRLLRMSDMSITEISNSSGFGTLRTFNRAFIKQMGMSPSEYKKNCRTDENIGVSIPAMNHADLLLPDELIFTDTTCQDPCVAVCSEFFYEADDNVSCKSDLGDDLDCACCDKGYPINFSGNNG